METRKKFFMECYLAGRKYHDADEVWDQLKVGTVLQLVRDLNNRYDVNAVALSFKAEDEEDYLIGYIPQTENEVLALFLEMGWTDMFECRICKIDPEAYSERQIKLTIKVKKNMA
jgi:hypothetical protein